MSIDEYNESKQETLDQLKGIYTICLLVSKWYILKTTLVNVNLNFSKIDFIKKSISFPLAKHFI